ncbi:MAG: hypothetical protein O3B75_03215 [Planctomycetota bacterium]|nr:hypothetical protein [Planctomycetota bacterium]
MARRAATSPMSFFSFQDIMACVTGIMILVTLILAIDPLSNQPLASTTPGQSEIIRKQLASAQERMKAAQESLEEKSAMLEAVRTTERVTGGQIQRIQQMQQEEERRLENTKKNKDAAAATLEKCESEIDLLTKDVKRAAEKERAIREQISNEQLKGRIIRQEGQFEPLQPILIEVTQEGVGIGNLDSEGVPKQTVFIHNEIMNRASLLWAAQWLKLLETYPPPSEANPMIGWYALFIIRDDSVREAMHLYSNLFPDKWEAGWQIWDSTKGGFFDPLEEPKP